MQADRSLSANVWKYYLFHFFLNLQLWFPIWIIYLTEERGLTLTQITLMDVPFWASIILLQVPGAAIADRWGRKPVLIGSTVAFSIAIFAFGLASSFPLLLGSYLVWGIGFSLLYGTESAFIYDSLKEAGQEDQYSRVYGRGWAVATAAGVGGTLLGAPLADATSLSFPILVSGGIAAMAGFVALTFREPSVVERTTAHPTYGKILRDSVRIVRRDREVRYSILFYGLITVGSIAPVWFFQVFLREHGVDVADVGIWQTPMRLAGIIGALAAHRLTRDLGERRLFYLMPALLLASYLVLAGWDSIYAQGAFSVANLVIILSQPVITDYLNRRVSSEQRATVVSLTSLARSFVLIPSAPLLGMLADAYSTRAAFLAGGAIIAVLGLPLMLLWLPGLRGEAPLPPEVEPVPAGD